MTKKIRTILFLGLLFLFVIIAPSIIFYSWGYRFDFQTKAIVKTGAFYFKVLPKSAQISITSLDNKGNLLKTKQISKKTDFFFGAALIENILPQKYQVQITKDGYFAWKKNLEIKGNSVVEAKNIVLIPQDVGINLIAQNVQNFFPSPDERTIILKEKAATTTTSSAASSITATTSGWSLKIFDVRNNVISQLIDSRDIAKNTQIDLLDLNFSPASQSLLLKTQIKKQVKYYFIDLTQSSYKAVPLDFLTPECQAIFFEPNNHQKLIFLKDSQVFEVDITEKATSSKMAENVKSLELSGSDFYYLDNSGFLYKTNSSFARQDKLNNAPFSFDKNSDYQIDVLSNWIYVQIGQKLYFLNSDTKSFEKFSDSVNEIKISPDFKKAVYYSDHEISVLFLEPELGQPQKEKGQKVFIARFSDKIGRVFWLTSNYLIFNVGEKTKVAEIDDRDVINIVNLTDSPSSEIYWNQNSKKLFINDSSNFYVTKQLVP